MSAPGYLDPYLTYAGRHRGLGPGSRDPRRQDRDTQHADPDVVPPDPARSTSGRSREIGTDPNNAAGRRDRAVPGRRVEDRRIRPPRPEPELLGQEGLRGRDHHPVSSRATDAMVQALKTGEHRLRPRRHRRPVQFAQEPAEHRDGRVVTGGRGERLHAARLQHLRQADQGRRRLDQGPPGPRLPRRARLRDRQAGARRQDARRLRARRHDDHPACQAAGKWHVEPTNPRTFDIELAKRKLDAAGYKLDASGKRLDKEGKAINLALVVAETPTTYTPDAQFIAEWFEASSGSTVDPAVDTTTAALDDAARGRPPGTADYDIFIWGWARRRRPELAAAASSPQTRSAPSSDSYYSNPHYDELYTQQQASRIRPSARRSSTEMQQLVYDEAPYHILYYDAELHAYRTDKFGGWKNQPRRTARRSSATAPATTTC